MLNLWRREILGEEEKLIHRSFNFDLMSSPTTGVSITPSSKPFSFKDMTFVSESSNITPSKTTPNKLLGRPAITFIIVDEIDALGDGKSNQSEKQLFIKQQLRDWFDLLNFYNRQIDKSRYWCIIGTSNRPQDIDPSLRRGGRFEVEIQVLTTKYDRQLLFNDLLSSFVCSDQSMNSNELAHLLSGNTGGYVAADIVALVDDVRSKYDDGRNLLSEAEWLSAFHESMTRILPSCLRGVTIEKPNLDYDDVIGCETAKIALNRLLQFTDPAKAKLREIFGISNVGGILLHGPPGNAKTRLVLAAASRHSLPLISLSSADIYSPYVGDAEAEIRKVFSLARQGSPCILFFDELDALVVNRSDSETSSSNVESRILATLLNEMDGVTTTSKSGSDVIVMAATNRIKAIDAALLRKGRFQHLLYVPLPSISELQQLLEYFALQFQLNEGWKYLANKLFIGQSGADVENLCREEKMKQMPKYV